MEERLALLQALLFVQGEPSPITQLAAAMGLAAQEVQDAAVDLERLLFDSGSSLQVLWLENRLQMTVRSRYLPVLQKLLRERQSQPLSPAALEVLAIVAYNQPVTRSFVEQVRGVNSNSIMATLTEKGLLEEAGRLELPGRPIAYRTTDGFLRSFGMSSLRDLPPVPSVEDGARHMEPDHITEEKTGN